MLFVQPLPNELSFLGSWRVSRAPAQRWHQVQCIPSRGEVSEGVQTLLDALTIIRDPVEGHVDHPGVEYRGADHENGCTRLRVHCFFNRNNNGKGLCVCSGAL
jgi:hypothetical protein